MNQKKTTPAAQMAMAGVFAALAVVCMSLGGLIPVFTYVSPMVCALILQMVLSLCGARVAWAWYGAVALLGVLLSPDKEAAAVFVFLGYYPIIKPKLDRRKAPLVWKLALFNVSIFVMYALLMYLFGFDQLRQEFSEFGVWMLAVLLLLGNVTFFLLDRVLSRRLPARRR